MLSEQNQTAEAGMMIRRPAPEVYEAFIEPAISTKFWFTKGTGRLDENKNVIWTWDMYNVSTEVKVVALEPGKKIKILWGGPEDETTAEWTFTPLGDSRTYVLVKNYGFKGSLDEIVRKMKDSTGGLTTVLDGLKAYLEHGIELNLILDKFPEELGNHGN